MRKNIFCFLFFVFLIGCEAQSNKTVPVKDVEDKVNLFFQKMNANKYRDIYENEFSNIYKEKYSYEDFESFIVFFHSNLGDYKKSKIKSSRLVISSKKGEAYFISYDAEFVNKPATMEFGYLPIDTENCNGLCLIHVGFTM